MGEILPYLELKEDNEKTKTETTVVTVPDIKYKTLDEAEKILKETGLKIKYESGKEKINKKQKIVKSPRSFLKWLRLKKKRRNLQNLQNLHIKRKKAECFLKQPVITYSVR